MVSKLVMPTLLDNNCHVLCALVIQNNTVRFLLLLFKMRKMDSETKILRLDSKDQALY